jgi:hypothetical protein
MPRGGKRKGAGRKKTADPTVVMRIPESKKELIIQWLKDSNGTIPKQPSPDKRYKINEALEVLQKALSLKANAGGKIKTEIRTAMSLLQNQRR